MSIAKLTVALRADTEQLEKDLARCAKMTRKAAKQMRKDLGGLHCCCCGKAIKLTVHVNVAPDDLVTR